MVLGHLHLALSWRKPFSHLFSGRYKALPVDGGMPLPTDPPYGSRPTPPYGSPYASLRVMLRLQRSKSLVFTEVLTALRVQQGGEGGSLVPSSKSELGWSRITGFLVSLPTRAYGVYSPS